MEQEKQKPDLSGRVNDFDITIYRRGRGLFIRVQKDDMEVGFFGIAGGSLDTSLPKPPEQVPAPHSQQSEVSAFPAPLPSDATLVVSADTKKAPEKPVVFAGVIDEIEGMGKTPASGDPVFRFSVKVVNAQTQQEEVKQIAAFRQIGQTLDLLTRSPDPHIKLIPGRLISMTAWDHSSTTGSYYPSSVNYLDLPAITNPKMQKRR